MLISYQTLPMASQHTQNKISIPYRVPLQGWATPTSRSHLLPPPPPQDAVEMLQSTSSLFLPRTPAVVVFFAQTVLPAVFTYPAPSCPSSFTSELPDYSTQNMPPPGTIIVPCFDFFHHLGLPAIVLCMYCLSGLQSHLPELKWKFHGPCLAHSCISHTWTRDEKV